MKTVTHSFSVNPFAGKGELTVLFAGNAQTAPCHKVGPQVLDYHLVHTVLEGKGSFRCRGEEYELGAGDSFLIVPGELVAYESDVEDPWRYRWIAFKGSQVDPTLASIGLSAHSPVVRAPDNRRIPALLRRTEKVFHEGGSSCDMEAGGLLRMAFAEYMKVTGLPHAAKDEPVPEIKQQVDKAVRWLTLQYSQPVSIEQMAQTLGYHRTHLSKLFKQHTGQSPMAYLHQIRMERAKLLLLEPLTIEQVASSVGFADALYFSKQFKKYTGQSPTDYRQKQLGRDRYDCASGSY